MSNILFISIGSGYNPAFEDKMGFVEEHLNKGNCVDIKSIDIKDYEQENVPPDSNNNNAPQLNINRICFELTQNNIQDFLTEHTPNIKKYNEIIICDSIHFVQSDIGNAVSSEIKSITNNCPIHLFRYTSFDMKEPQFNGASFFDKAQFISASNFLEQHQEHIKQLFKNPRQADKVLSSLVKQTKKTPILGFHYINDFLQGAGKKLLVSGSKAKVSNLLTEYASQNITSSLIEENTYKPKRRLK